MFSDWGCWWDSRNKTETGAQTIDGIWWHDGPIKADAAVKDGGDWEVENKRQTENHIKENKKHDDDDWLNNDGGWFKKNNKISKSSANLI